MLPGLPEPVPFEEVAAVLAEAVSRVQGAPPALIGASSRHLAAALELAGFHVVRTPADAVSPLLRGLNVRFDRRFLRLFFAQPLIRRHMLLVDMLTT